MHLICCVGDPALNISLSFGFLELAKKLLGGRSKDSAHETRRPRSRAVLTLTDLLKQASRDIHAPLHSISLNQFDLSHVL